MTLSSFCSSLDESRHTWCIRPECECGCHKQNEAAELQRQKAECLDWLEENRERIGELSFCDGKWMIHMSPKPGYYEYFKGKTLHEAIQAVREAEKQ